MNYLDSVPIKGRKKSRWDHASVRTSGIISANARQSVKLGSTFFRAPHLTRFLGRNLFHKIWEVEFRGAGVFRDSKASSSMRWSPQQFRGELKLRGCVLYL